MDLKDLLPHLIYQFKHEHDLVVAIEELSAKFTIDREHVGDYLKDPRLVSAYTAFYFTTNLPKLAAIQKWLPEAWVKDLMHCDLVDVGAGPGTFSLAFSELFPDFSGEVFQIEKSNLMKDQAKKLWDALRPQKKLHQEWPVSSRKNFVIFGHSANEMGPQLTITAIEKLNPEHILFVEPGTKSFFQDMLKIRSALISQGFNVLYPCPANLECPMKGTEDWCHQFVEVSHNADVERLTQMVRKDRRYLPLTVHAFSKSSYGKNPSERLVRVLPETKFSFDWEVCHNHQLQHYQVMKRPYKKPELKSLSQVLAGAALDTTLEKDLESCRRVTLNQLPK